MNTQYKLTTAAALVLASGMAFAQTEGAGEIGATGQGGATSDQGSFDGSGSIHGELGASSGAEGESPSATGSAAGRGLGIRCLHLRVLERRFRRQRCRHRGRIRRLLHRFLGFDGTRFR